jgi:hypothetical protein
MVHEKRRAWFRITLEANHSDFRAGLFRVLHSQASYPMKALGQSGCNFCAFGTQDSYQKNGRTQRFHHHPKSNHRTTLSARPTMNTIALHIKSAIF